ncbi:MAG: hypothetical protein ACXADL_17835 [Candidatus Thorarchaeota archaeon]|jgi:hypothetical protein
MASKKDIGTNRKIELNKHQQTSIGHSANTNPKNKHKRKGKDTGGRVNEKPVGKRS